jgi:hypothetical protein
MAELEYVEKRMRQKWYELVMAEQRGASLQSLERLYNAYMLAVEEYNHRLQAEEEHEQPRLLSPERTHQRKRAS